MEMLQLREKEIFNTLQKIKRFEFVVIGGYAVNAYTLPRFSVDCDIVVKDKIDLKKIEEQLKDIDYHKEESSKLSTPYLGEFVRYMKEIKKNIKVSMDILIGNVLDRQTNATFSADWVFQNSKKRLLQGKTISEEL